MVSECDVCQRHKYSTMAPETLELPLDFIDGLPWFAGYSAIFVVVDRLSKYALFVPLKHLYMAVSVATFFLREMVHLYGVPTSIKSDRDKVFLSSFWKELFRLHGMVLKRSKT